MPAEYTSRWFARLAFWGTVLTFCVVILGAFVRLSHAGLGCPDWPVCYGYLAWPSAEEQIVLANEAFPHRPVEVDKAWKEQVHRFLAAALGIVVFALALMANWRSRAQRYTLIGASLAAAGGIFTYVAGLVSIASILSVLSIALPLYGALTWRNGGWRARYTAGLLALIIVQAMLGMWTVTLLVKPIIVTAHLLGGMATFILMWLLWLRNRGGLKANEDDRYRSLRILSYMAIGVVTLQIFLGGWTSTNYAALACPDFPTCQTRWVPPMDFSEGFKLWRGLGVDYEGGVLDNDARVAVHYTHRLGAILVLLVVGALVFGIRRRAQSHLGEGSGESDATLRLLGAILGAFLIGQILLGISVVKFGLPLWLAVSHNGGAALLLASLVTVSYALTPSANPDRRIT